MPEQDAKELFDPKKFMKEFAAAIEDEAKNNANIEIKSVPKRRKDKVNITDAINMSLFDEQ